jgi:hypothetical protein
MTTNLTMVVLALALALAASACRDHEAARTQAGAAPGEVPAARSPLHGATQGDLARELARAELDGSWQDVRARWHGQRLRWTVRRPYALCRSAESCHVAAFPVGSGVTQGWLPQLSFSPGEYAKLDGACGASDACELELEGTLDLRVSDELPTAVRFASVRVLRAGADG